MSITKKLEENNSYKRQLIAVSLGIVILILAELWISNTMISSGERLVELEKLQQNLKLENLNLENELAEYLSLENVASVSASFGFSKPKEVKYLR